MPNGHECLQQCLWRFGASLERILVVPVRIMEQANDGIGEVTNEWVVERSGIRVGVKTPNDLASRHMIYPFGRKKEKKRKLIYENS